MKDDLIALAKVLVAKSDGHLRLAFNEDDITEAKVADAAHFLKLDGRRVGRDIELYGFMSKVAGNAMAVTDFLAEVLLPIQSTCVESFRVGLEAMRGLVGVFPNDRRAEWLEMINDFMPAQPVLTGD